MSYNPNAKAPSSPTTGIASDATAPIAVPVSATAELAAGTTGLTSTESQYQATSLTTSAA